jgi:mannose-6-phosphate isomerase-like protein (cupin superfamily)
MKIRLGEHKRFDRDKLTKVALARTPRVQLDLYCVNPGQSQKAHTHTDQDKFYLVLEGSGRFTVGGSEERLGAGEAALAAAGQEHGLVNDGAVPLVVLVVMSPPPPH